MTPGLPLSLAGLRIPTFIDNGQSKCFHYEEGWMIISLKGHVYDNAKNQAPQEKRIFVWYPQKANRYNHSFQPVAR